MAMQPQTYSISGLSTELGIDRRTLAKRLANLPPAEVVRGRSKRWRIQDVLKVLDASSPPNVGSDENTPRQILDAFAMSMDILIPWLHKDIVPFSEYSRQIGIDHDEVAQWVIYGFPLLPPAEGETDARVSIPHAERWRAMFTGFLYTLGADPKNEDLAEEARRIRGLPA